MAGSASNWFKPTSGPFKGRAMYLSQDQQRRFVYGADHAKVLAAAGARDPVATRADLRKTRSKILYELNNPITDASGRISTTGRDGVALGAALDAQRPAGAAKSGPAGTTAPPTGSWSHPRQAAKPLDTQAATKAVLAARQRKYARLMQYAENTPGDVELGALYQLQGFHAKPQVVSKAQLDQLIADGGAELFRGVHGYRSYSANMSMTAAEIQNAMRTGDEHFPGHGIYGNGSYFAMVSPALDQVRAKRTAGRYTDGSSGSMIRAAVDPRARIGEHDTLYQEMDTRRTQLEAQADQLSSAARAAVPKRYLPMINKLRAEQDTYLTPAGKIPRGNNQKAKAWNATGQRLNRVLARYAREKDRAARANGAGAIRDEMDATLSDVGHYAVMRGYDAIRESNQSYLVVLNRGVLAIQDTDPS